MKNNTILLTIAITAIDPENFKFRIDIGAINEHTWSSNGQHYYTIEEAKRKLDNLASRWFGFNVARIVPASTVIGESIDLSDSYIVMNERK